MMHFLIEITHEPAAGDALRTMVMEAGEKFSSAMAGKKSEGSRIEGCWVALESGTAYLVMETKDGIPVYELCHEVTQCAAGIKVRVIPVLPVGQLAKKF
jgi:hypothetical protein